MGARIMYWTWEEYFFLVKYNLRLIIVRGVGVQVNRLLESSVMLGLICAPFTNQEGWQFVIWLTFRVIKT